MAYTIGDIKADLQRKLHGTTLNKVSGVNALIFEAARNVLMTIDPQETKRQVLLDTPLYDNVWRYTAPTDLKGNKVIDIRQTDDERSRRDNFNQTYSERFDQTKAEAGQQMFTVEYDSGVKFLRIANDNLTAGQLLHDMNYIATNGAWAVGNDATNLTEDTLRKVSGRAALRFDLDGATTDGYIENSTFTAIDLSEIEDIGSIFARVYIPNTDVFTSVTLRWGDSSSAYWEVTATLVHDGTAPQIGWNRFRFDWSGATQVGTPDSASVNYARVGITYNGTATQGFLVDDITAAQGKEFEILYYSKYIFQTENGVFIEEPTQDSDIVNLDTEAYNILLYEASYLVALEIHGEDSEADASFYRKKLHGDNTPNNLGIYKEYKSQYKSEVEKPRQSYYRMPRRGRRG